MEEINLGNLKIDQLGYVYKDIKKQAKIFEEKLGFSKFLFLTNKPSPYLYRGKETTVQTMLGFSRSLSIQVELIQLLEGNCIFKEFIDSGREGLHHFGVFVDNVDILVKKYQEMGYQVVHQGLTAGVRKVAYIDTLDDLGVYIEFQGSKKKRKKK